MAVFEELCCVDRTMKHTCKRQTAPMQCRGSRQHRESNDRTCAQRWPLPPPTPPLLPGRKRVPTGPGLGLLTTPGPQPASTRGAYSVDLGGARGGLAQAMPLPSPSMLWAGGGEGTGQGLPSLHPELRKKPTSSSRRQEVPAGGVWDQPGGPRRFQVTVPPQPSPQTRGLSPPGPDPPGPPASAPERVCLDSGCR